MFSDGHLGRFFSKFAKPLRLSDVFRVLISAISRRRFPSAISSGLLTFPVCKAFPRVRRRGRFSAASLFAKRLRSAEKRPRRRTRGKALHTGKVSNPEEIAL